MATCFAVSVGTGLRATGSSAPDLYSNPSQLGVQTNLESPSTVSSCGTGNNVAKTVAKAKPQQKGSGMEGRNKAKNKRSTAVASNPLSGAYPPSTRDASVTKANCRRKIAGGVSYRLLSVTPEVHDGKSQFSVVAVDQKLRRLIVIHKSIEDFKALRTCLMRATVPLALSSNKIFCKKCASLWNHLNCDSFFSLYHRIFVRRAQSVEDQALALYRTFAVVMDMISKNSSCLRCDQCVDCRLVLREWLGFSYKGGEKYLAKSLQVDTFTSSAIPRTSSGSELCTLVEDKEEEEEVVAAQEDEGQWW